MATRQHHYVPRFYLSQFASKPKRINLYNLQRKVAKQDVSLKDQCKKPNFYGEADVEQALSLLEAKAAKCIDRLVNNPSTKPTEEILEFVAVQYLRTPAFAKTMDEMSKKLFGLVTSGMTLEKRTEVLSSLMGPDEMPIFSLTMKDHIVEDIKDLKHIVIGHRKEVFITSDNPAYFYNQYCQMVQGRGKTGSRNSGLQIFMPLSPKSYLILYDGETYDHVKKQSVIMSDVHALNSIQAVSAEANLYFPDWDQSTEVGKLAVQASHIKTTRAPVAEQFESEEDANDTLLHTYVETPNLDLNLSFLRIKKRALRVPMNKRWGRRKGKSQALHSHSLPPIGPRTYSKRIAKV